MLHKFGLAQTTYLDLVNQKKPLELIFKLYEGGGTKSHFHSRIFFHKCLGRINCLNLKKCTNVKIKIALMGRGLSLCLKPKLYSTLYSSSI